MAVGRAAAAAAAPRSGWVADTARTGPVTRGKAEHTIKRKEEREGD